MIRTARPADAASVQAIYAPYVRDSSISFEIIAPTVEDMSERMRATQARYPWLVCEESEEILGYAYAGQHRTREAYRWSVDVAVYVKQGQAGRGIGRQLYDVLLRQLRDLGYANAFAGITLPNAASVGLHEAMGFVPIRIYHKVGFKQGQWHDVGWWQLSLGHPQNPSEPRLTNSSSEAPATAVVPIPPKHSEPNR